MTGLYAARLASPARDGIYGSASRILSTRDWKLQSPIRPPAIDKDIKQDTEVARYGARTDADFVSLVSGSSADLSSRFTVFGLLAYLVYRD
jgi:hypothetical protein